jgi:hypothetical protein
MCGGEGDEKAYRSRTRDRSPRGRPAEGDKLHKDGKHAESVKKYEEAAKGAGLTLTRKK